MKTAQHFSGAIVGLSHCDNCCETSLKLYRITCLYAYIFTAAVELVSTSMKHDHTNSIKYEIKFAVFNEGLTRGPDIDKLDQVEPVTSEPGRQ